MPAKGWIGPALAWLVILAVAVPASAARSPWVDARSGLDTLATLRGANGSYDPGMAPLAVEAAVALGVDPAEWPNPAHSALAALPPPRPGGDLLPQLRPIYARAVAGHATPQDTAAVQAGFRNGQFGELLLLNDDAWGIRALRALGLPPGDDLVRAAANWLVERQGPDGGWSWRIGSPTGTDATGMTLVALAEAEVLPADTVERARAYLAARRDNATGGYPENDGAANCDSTVWAIRALRVLGEPEPADAWAFLAGLHHADGGYSYQPGQPSNPLCTAEVVALLGQWSAAGRDLRGYTGPTRGAPSVTMGILAALALGVALVAGRPPRRIARRIARRIGSRK